MRTAAVRRCRATACVAWAHGSRPSAARRCPANRRPSKSRPTPASSVSSCSRARTGRYTFRAAMGVPEQVDADDDRGRRLPVDVVTLRVGNPQCVVLGEVTERPAARRRVAARGASAFSGRHERRAGVGRGAGPRADPDLGTRSRSDRGVRNGRMRGGGGRDPIRRRRSRRARSCRPAGLSASSGRTRACS